jgi:hypothetical protein
LIAIAVAVAVDREPHARRARLVFGADNMHSQIIVCVIAGISEGIFVSHLEQ